MANHSILVRPEMQTRGFCNRHLGTERPSDPDEKGQSGSTVGALTNNTLHRGHPRLSMTLGVRGGGVGV